MYLAGETGSYLGPMYYNKNYYF